MSKKLETVETVGKTKSKGMKALLNSTVLNEKLAGVVRVFGMCEELRSEVKAQTIANRCTKIGLSLRNDHTEEQLRADKDLMEAAKFISSNFGDIKTCATDKEAEFTEDMQKAYNAFKAYGKSTPTDKIPDTLDF